MSHYIIKKMPFTITIGWDAPLGYYHLIIEKDDEMIWSNLDQKIKFPMNYDEYIEVIKRITGIDLPDMIKQHLDQDKIINRGNYSETLVIE